MSDMPEEAAKPIHVARVRSIRGELIEDREVSASEPDRLRHTQLGQQLADLAMNVPMPTNIALYGPWGSGKTGIGNIVKTELEKRNKHNSAQVGYARFDAFKYAENPLRRNFVSAVAAELGETDRKFHEDLYTGQVKTEYDIEPAGVLKLTGLFLLLAAFIAAGLLVLVVLVVGVRGGDFSDGFGELAGKALTAALPPAAVLAAVVALVGKGFGVERKTDKAESGEQFEKVFAELVRKAGKDRLVIFVDELDRCDSKDVVATLDAIRTFLGVTGCVFIVAADRQVIEEALSEDVKQSTPADRVNPYYSAGSAYLDKVFQHQMTVPPLLPHSITKFAAELVRGRPGVWTELGANLDVTVSVLVPSHVRSPRRVKNLLNAFVLAYRLAEARQADGLLAGDLAGRADEIARLVCLRVEFPLFARNLVLDARLPRYVFELSQLDGTDSGFWQRYPHAADEVKELAEDYAGLRAPVATLLADDDTEGAGAEAEDPEHEDTRPRTDRSVQKQHGRQLLDYLSRTRDVDGPGRDLLYLQNPGSLVGLESDIAEQIEQAAANGAARSLLGLVDGLTPEQLQGVLELLTQQVKNSIGVEARNVTVSILAVAARPDVDLSDRADALVDALAPAVGSSPGWINAETIPGAWRIGLESTRPTAELLRRLVLQSEAASEDDAVAQMIMSQADEALAVDAERTAQLLASHLVHGNQESTTNTLVSLPPAESARLLRAARSTMEEDLRDFLARAEAAQAADAPAQPTVRPATGTATPAPEQPAGPTPEEVEARLELFATLLERLEAGTGGPAQEILWILLGVDNGKIHALIERVIDHAGAVAEPALVARLLTVTNRRRPQVWRPWLTAVPREASSGVEADQPLASLSTLLWRESVRSTGRLSDEKLQEAAALLASLVEQRPVERRPDLIETVRDSLGPPATDDDTAQERMRIHEGAAILIRSGILPPSVLVDIEVAHLTETLAAERGATHAEATPHDPLVDYVVQTLSAVLRGWPTPGAAPAPPSDEQARVLIDAVSACSWLPEPHATALPLIARTLHEGSGDPDLPSADAMAALRREHGAGVDDAIAAWVHLARPEPLALHEAVAEALSATAPAPSLISAVQDATARYTATQRSSLLRQILKDPAAPPLAPASLAAIRGTLPDRDVAHILSDRYGRASSNPQRRHVLDLWQNADITSDAARRELVENVLMPLFALNHDGGNIGAVELGLDYLPRLVRPFPPGIRQPLGKCIVAATQPYGLRPKAEAAMLSAGYSKKSKGWQFWRVDEIEVE